MEIIVRHGGTPADQVGIRVEIADDPETGSVNVPYGWPDVVPRPTTPTDLNKKPTPHPDAEGTRMYADEYARSTPSGPPTTKSGRRTGIKR